MDLDDALDALKEGIDETIERAEREARAEERERCARIAEFAYRDQPFLAQPGAIVLGGYIADAIREAGEED